MGSPQKLSYSIDKTQLRPTTAKFMSIKKATFYIRNIVLVPYLHEARVVVL